MLLNINIITIFLSSILLFFIQPLFAKQLLSIFGGVPTVWNMCLIFFQGTLLLGYLNIYFITRYLSNRNQLAFYFLFLILSLCVLPIEINYFQIGNNPALDIIWILVTNLLLPVFVLSMTSPLLQYWFGQTNHPSAKDPYFLYSASSFGNLIALISFPFLFEPLIGLRDLSKSWSIAYIFLTILLITVASKTQQKKKFFNENVIKKTKMSLKIRVSWLLLSFATSSLLMAVTQYITTDIIAVPLLWVLPLALYLLTFVITFASHPIISHDWMRRNLIWFLLFPLLSLVQSSFILSAPIIILLNLLSFFALIMVCHGELAASRPEKEYLTEFYIWIALGGFLGGVFNGVIVPHVFTGMCEYYIAFCLCVFLLPNLQSKFLFKFAYITPFLIAAILMINYYLAPSFTLNQLKWIDLSVQLIAILFIIVSHQRTWILAINIAILLCFAQSAINFKQKDLIWQSRNFFGVARIYKNDQFNLHVLMNGKTIHGVQSFSQSTEYNRRSSYYDPIQSIANLIISHDNPLKIGIAGLGAGSLSCQFRKQDKITFFEIDPKIVDIAKNPRFFTYLSECPPKGGIVIGDARLSISATAEHSFDVIIIDVYSSDAIPMHLFTLEAMQSYLDKLAPDGVLIFNISSRYFNFNPIFLGVANKLNLIALNYQSTSHYKNLQLASQWVLLTKNVKLSQKLQIMSQWKTLPVQKSVLWTDDFSNILAIVKTI